MAGRSPHYTTTLPLGRAGPRRTVASSVSVVLHLLLLAFLVRQSIARRAEPEDKPATASERPIQLVFAPPRPQPTPRRTAPEVPPVQEPPPPVPAVPLTPGPDQSPGSTARVTPTPEPEPNAPPNSARQEATRPDPDPGTDQPARRPASPPPASIAAPAPATDAAPTLESDARRLFGRPSTKLGPVSGSRDNRPWESPVELSRGCTLPPEENDSTAPPGMAVVAGRIYREDNGQPLPGARLQILGTEYGTFSNGEGYYRLVFDRSLVDRCRTQSVRVSAPGYAGRDVILYVGERASSDVPLRRY
jgi:Carboxypeptidase regulatory-like domain